MFQGLVVLLRLSRTPKVHIFNQDISSLNNKNKRSITMKDRKEGCGGKAHSELPAAFVHEHSPAHGVGLTFAGAHGFDHEGHNIATKEGPLDIIGGAKGAAEFDDPDR
jgi:hypothetical protein